MIECESSPTIFLDLAHKNDAGLVRYMLRQLVNNPIPLPYCI